MYENNVHRNSKDLFTLSEAQLIKSDDLGMATESGLSLVRSTEFFCHSIFVLVMILKKYEWTFILLYILHIREIIDKNAHH